jgi:uncharacterized membrane protein
MKGLTFSSAAVALVAIVAGACTADIPSAAVPTDPALAKGGPGGPSAPAAYTVLDVGALLPGSPSEARGVNDVGDVVGFYGSGPTYPYAVVSGLPVTLGGGTGWAVGISNGNPAYVAGHVGLGNWNVPARWSLADPTQPTYLPLAAGETFGFAKDVNDAGDAVGSVNSNAAMWLADGTRIPIATPAGFATGEGRGIDNAGLAVFQFFTVPRGSADRGYLRLGSGALIQLPPVGTDVLSYVNDVSEVANGLVYVAGSTNSGGQVSRAVRWTVDAATGAIVATSVLATTGSHGLGVSDAGGIAGFFDTEGARRIEPFLWRGTSVLQLAPPKGTRDARALALSRSGRYVAGDVHSALRALRWTIASP